MIFVFLRNVSATVIPSLAVPLSLLGTFAAMKLLGFTIDMLSMMAMTLSVGFVVDDAIVMLENIVRHMEMGKPRMQAALEGAREVGFHDHFDDGFVGRRLHSGAVFRRHYRPSIARVLNYDRCGRTHFRRDFADAHAHAVQPLSAP